MFNRKKLLKAFDAVPELQHGYVQYMDSGDAKSLATLGKLPYLKHLRYADEGEYRAFVGSQMEITQPPTVKITPDMISRITLSPWLHTSLKEPVEFAIQSIPGMEKVKVYRSTLIEYSDWRSIAESCSE